MSSMIVAPTQKFTRDSCPIEVTDEASLREGFKRAFHPDSCARVWLIYSVTRNIEAYRLSGVDAWDILTEAYLRAGLAIQQGKLIWNLVSWLKSTSSLIILEHKRRFARSDTTSYPEMDFFWDIDELLPDDYVQASNYAKYITGELNNAIRCKLSDLERRLLVWRIQKGLSWKDIYHLLEANGEGPTNEANLRKKKQRAVQKIRNALKKTGATKSKLTRQEALYVAHSLLMSLTTQEANK